MIVKLAHICVETTDLEASESFYNALGAERRFEFRNLQGMLIGMYMHFAGDTFIELVLVKTPRVEGAINHFALQVEDVAETHRKLVQAGIDVTEKELGVDHTWMVTCRDPNGVYIEFHQYTADSLQFTGGACQIDYTP